MFGEFLNIIFKSIKLDKTLYSDKPGQPVDAVVVDIPFKESFNANTREVVKG